jgi:hypothetical protein
MGWLFFISYFFEDSPFFNIFIIFAKYTALYKSDKKRVFVYAAMFWGMALLFGFPFIYYAYSHILSFLRF